MHVHPVDESKSESNSDYYTRCTALVRLGPPSLPSFVVNSSCVSANSGSSIILLTPNSAPCPPPVPSMAGVKVMAPCSHSQRRRGGCSQVVTTASGQTPLQCSPCGRVVAKVHSDGRGAKALKDLGPQSILALLPPPDSAHEEALSPFAQHSECAARSFSRWQSG